MLRPSFTTQIPRYPLLAKDKHADRFETERRLVVEFTSRVSSLDYHICHEFDSTYGIADIVLFRRTSSDHNGTDLSSIPDRWAYAFRQLPYRKKFSTSDLASLASTNHTHARKILSQGASGGYINQSGPNLWIKHRQPQPIANEIIAIEAKLTKWKSALSQAIKYRHFAHQSWVLLDNQTRGAAIDNLQEFQRFNIGLLSIDQCGNVISHFTPIRSCPKSPQLFWLANVRLAHSLLQMTPIKSVDCGQPS